MKMEILSLAEVFWSFILMIFFATGFGFETVWSLEATN
jgi:hypothetical protein